MRFALALALACRCGAAPPAPRAEHAQPADALLTAFLAGEELAGPARALEAPPGGEEAMHAALGFLMVAEGPEEEAEGLAALAEACAACHQAAGLRSDAAALPPAEGPGGRLSRAWWAEALGLTPQRDEALAGLGSLPEALEAARRTPESP